MRYQEKHIFVVVEMAGHQGLWILDSGASATCIDERFAREPRTRDGRRDAEVPEPEVR